MRVHLRWCHKPRRVIFRCVSGIESNDCSAGGGWPIRSAETWAMLTTTSGALIGFICIVYNPRPSVIYVMVVTIVQLSILYQRFPIPGISWRRRSHIHQFSNTIVRKQDILTVGGFFFHFEIQKNITHVYQGSRLRRILAFWGNPCPQIW